MVTAAEGLPLADKIGDAVGGVGDLVGGIGDAIGSIFWVRGNWIFSFQFV
jgi:hypothetical protein